MTAPTQADRFGRSLRMDDGDLVVAGDRLVEIGGVANLTQALTLRVLTPRGSDPFNTGYGLDIASIFTEPNGVRMVKELVKLNLVSTLSTDPRVREVRRITFNDDRERLTTDPAAREKLRADRHRRLWTVEVEVLTVAGVPATVLIDVEV
jgi:hypothetical protein